ncbi:MAG: hypothetical protein LBJ92_00565 [Holosporales bacterium]|nr:hypothetical protein [Holosporales bacterium]
MFLCYSLIHYPHFVFIRPFSQKSSESDLMEGETAHRAAVYARIWVLD